MGQEFKGRVVNGKVELLEESDLEEGEEVWVVAPMRPRGEGEDDYNHWEEVLSNIYERRRRSYLESKEIIIYYD